MVQKKNKAFPYVVTVCRRIEQFEVVAWPKSKYGKFHTGDSYIVLNTEKDSSGKFIWNVHFWLGTYTTQDEAGTAAYKTVELDDFLGGDPVEHREVQGYESDQFLEYFPNGITILPGGVDSGFTHVEEEVVRTTLLQVKGRLLHNVVVREVPLSSASLNSGDCFVLDNFMTIYTFVGRRAGSGERARASQVAQALDDSRGGKPQKVTIMEYEMNGDDVDINKFWELLGGRVSTIASIKEGGSDDHVHKEGERMVRISDASGSLQSTAVPFSRDSLCSKDCFIIDVVSEVFVWVGNRASRNERRNALGMGSRYLIENNRPPFTHLTRVIQGSEPPTLALFF
eukprot:TRINITY_DN214_c0_g1_i1.p1 TRINITY_DN214_c0_g1~~TRINITY_DN214_c0_g1_i1.p1  ORF type:complete len:340 (-),score=46.35 TRINITY_DN214_c0_g1_i1:212-1231(-)